MLYRGGHAVKPNPLGGATEIGRVPRPRLRYSRPLSPEEIGRYWRPRRVLGPRPAVDSGLHRGVPEMPINDRPLSPSVPGRLPCANRVEVDAGIDIVSAADVRAWVTHLRSHGWTDTELDLVWITRARQGVVR